MKTYTPRMIIANTVSDVLLSVPVRPHSGSLAAVSPRKLWLAEEGDIVVTSAPVSEAFQTYVSSILGIERGTVTVITVPYVENQPFAATLLAPDILRQLKVAVSKRREVRMVPFALDRSVVSLADALSLAIDGYEDLDTAARVAEHVYSLNTKSAFRALATSLGLPIVSGTSCFSRESVVREAMKLFVNSDIIIKLDRSSNGFGHLFVRRSDNGQESIELLITRRLEELAEQPAAYTIETLMHFVSVPSVEMEIGASGRPVLLYLCDQRCPNGSFTGMVSDSSAVAPKFRDMLLRFGEVIGNYLSQIGYRGVFDVDAGVTAEGALFVTEMNLRRTGGTYIDSLMRRLLGETYASSYSWLSDSKRMRRYISFSEMLAILENKRINFNLTKKEGVILTADTTLVDQRCRYVAVAPSVTRAQELEDIFLDDLESNGLM